jgi:hypothetical protein
VRHISIPPGKAPGFSFEFTALADGRVLIVIAHLADDGNYTQAQSTVLASSVPALRNVARRIDKACADAEAAGAALAARDGTQQDAKP